jgi:hypothetical protein
MAITGVITYRFRGWFSSVHPPYNNSRTQGGGDEFRSGKRLHIIRLYCKQAEVAIKKNNHKSWKQLTCKHTVAIIHCKDKYQFMQRRTWCVLSFVNMSVYPSNYKICVT